MWKGNIILFISKIIKWHLKFEPAICSDINDHEPISNFLPPLNLL